MDLRWTDYECGCGASHKVAVCHEAGGRSRAAVRAVEFTCDTMRAVDKMPLVALARLSEHKYVKLLAAIMAPERVSSYCPTCGEPCVLRVASVMGFVWSLVVSFGCGHVAPLNGSRLPLSEYDVTRISQISADVRPWLDALLEELAPWLAGTRAPAAKPPRAKRRLGVVVVDLDRDDLSVCNRARPVVTGDVVVIQASDGAEVGAVPEVRQVGEIGDLVPVGWVDKSIVERVRRAIHDAFPGEQVPAGYGKDDVPVPVLSKGTDPMEVYEVKYPGISTNPSAALRDKLCGDPAPVHGRVHFQAVYDSAEIGKEISERVRYAFREKYPALSAECDKLSASGARESLRQAIDGAIESFNRSQPAAHLALPEAVAASTYAGEPVRWECHRCSYHTKTTRGFRTCPSCGHAEKCEPRCDKRSPDPGDHGTTTQPMNRWPFPSGRP